MPLPPGYAIHPTTGAITGRATAAAAVGGNATDYTFTVEARTADGRAARFRETIRIHPLPVVTLTTPAGTVGIAYVGSTSVTNSAQCSAPLAYSISSGALPTDVAINAATGALTGTPSAAGTFTGNLRVTGDKGGFTDTAFSITIAAA
jgi:hypothetical protein